MSTTLLALAQSIARELGYASGTATSGTTASLTDSSTDSPLDKADHNTLYANSYLKIESDSAGTPLNVGEVRRVKTYVPASQVVNWDTAMSNAVTSTQGYGLYLRVPPENLGVLKGIRSFINDILPHLHYRYPVLLSLVTDADCETSGVAAWSDVGTCTQAKSTTTGVTYGKQALSLTNTAADSGVKNATTIPVVEGQVYQICADVRCDGYTANLKIYDATNAATIDVVKATAERGQRFLYNQVTIPSSCKEMEIHLLATGASAVHYWDNISVRQAYATEMALPTWFTNPLWLEGVYYTYGGRREQDNDSWSTDEREWIPVHNWGIVDDPAGIGYKVWFEGTQIPASSHLWAICRRPGAALSADTDTTDIDPNLIKASALARIYADIAGTGDKAAQGQVARWLAERDDLGRRRGMQTVQRAWKPLRNF